MKRPSFQFYPGDWMSDLKLRRCSPAARGVWMDILCAMHDSDDGYGLLRWPLKEIASTVGASISHVRELVDKGVLRGSDSEVGEPLVYQSKSGRKLGAAVTLIEAQAGPLWYSKRLVEDQHVRTMRGESSRFGDYVEQPPKPPPKAAPKPPIGEGKSDGSSSPTPSPTSSKQEPEREENASRAAEKAEDTAVADGFEPTPAGLMCRAMRRTGFSATNPGDPRLLKLIAEGATEAEFVGLAREAVAKGMGNAWAWLLKALENRRAEAAAIALAPATPPPQATVPSGDADKTRAMLDAQRLTDEDKAKIREQARQMREAMRP